MMGRPDSSVVRVIPGRKISFGPLVPGPLGLIELGILYDAYKINPYKFQPLGDEYDDKIVVIFEHMRQGVSIDAFLADPVKSKNFVAKCRSAGINASHYQICMRLFAIRKTKGSSVFRPTEMVTRADNLMDRYSPGVEVSLLKVSTETGASVDDMIAHPELGKDFVRIAKKISPGGTHREYRLCALQVRKNRTLGGKAGSQAVGLDPQMIEDRWLSLGRVGHLEGLALDVGPSRGLAELRHEEKTLFVLRSANLQDAVENVFLPAVVRGMIQHDWYGDNFTKDVTVRVAPSNALPKLATPKAWELSIIAIEQPPFNWPVKLVA